MSLSMYRATIPVLTRALGVLGHVLDKASAHAAEHGVDPADLVGARLWPDMYDLAGQVQRASDTAKFSGQRLSGVASPAFPDTEKTLDELKARVQGTIAWLESIDPATLEGADERVIELKVGPNVTPFTGADYLFNFAVPNIYFHVTAAYAILRNKGVPVGKADYLRLNG